MSIIKENRMNSMKIVFNEDDELNYEDSQHGNTILDIIK